MVVGYGQICASGKSGAILFGKAGTILWKDCNLKKKPIEPVGMPCNIIISWSDPTGDLDIVGFWTKSKGETAYDQSNTNCGWNWSNGIIPWPGEDTPAEDWPTPTKKVNGYADWWSGDNTSGGPEKLRIDCDDKENVDDTFEVRCNWFRGTGTATLTIVDSEGNQLQRTIQPEEGRQGSKAYTTDHGFIIHFSQKGIITSLETV